jgi:dipeptidyl-peptidase 4
VSKDKQNTVTFLEYARAEQKLPWHLDKLVFNAELKPNWLRAGKFWYLCQTRTGMTFMLIDAVNNTRSQLFDVVKLCEILTSQTGIKHDAKELEFDWLEYNEDTNVIKFAPRSNPEELAITWQCDLASYACTNLTEQGTTSGIYSPNKKYLVFTKQHNLWLRSVETGQEQPLTTDGELYYGYADSPDTRLSSVSEYKQGQEPMLELRWSPDSRYVLVARADQRQVKPLHILDPLPSKESGQRPVLYSPRIPVPGDAVLPHYELYIFDIEKTKGFRVEAEPLLALYPLFENGLAWWSDTSEHVYFLVEGRGYHRLTLYAAHVVTGKVEKLVEEFSDTHIQPTHIQPGAYRYPPEVKVLEKNNEVIWFSERDGWGHLYLYQQGVLKRQLTSGPWLVHNLMWVDEDSRQLYFTAGGREANRDPYYRHLYRTSLDEDAPILLTPEDADHSVSMSLCGQYFVDTYSRVDSAPVSVLRSAEGELLQTLETADITDLLASGWAYPERFCVKARDGVTDLYGVLYRPTQLDPTKKYSLLDYIYGGPQITQATPSFAASFEDAQALNELGFIVMTLDGVGTPLRSKAFHNFSYGAGFAEAGGLIDHVGAIRQLAARYPYIDLERIGIYGHSAGGYAAARALLLFPEFFKVGVSSSGSHDARLYNARWGERYIGLPENNKEAYELQANITLVDQLRGKLLLMQGVVDDDVDMANTLQLVEAFIRADKEVDLIILPSANHDCFMHPYVMRRRWAYFVEHFLNHQYPFTIEKGNPT